MTAVSGLVARALDERLSLPEANCQLGERLAREAGIQPGQLAWVRTAAQRLVLVRVDELLSGADEVLVRLPRLMRQSLKARLNERVLVESAEGGQVEEITLLPAADVSTAVGHNLSEHIKQRLVANATPVSEGLNFYATFPGSVAGTTYRVLRLSGQPGLVTDSTRVRLEFTADAMLTELALDVTFADVGGLDAQVKLIRELVEIPLKFPFRYRELGINPPKGILFTGPPGTGKTHVARALAQEADARFFSINGPEVVGTIYGETEGNLRSVFAEATHHAPSLILIDEIDALAPPRGETGAHSDTRMVTQLLSLMDGLKRTDGVIVVGTTNRVDALDVALRRPGRFDREIYFGPPDTHGRHEILQIHTREMPVTADAVDCLQDIAARTPGFVGADLMEVCREAGLNAMRRASVAMGDWPTLSHLPVEAATLPPVRITADDFYGALDHIRPSASRQALAIKPDVPWRDIGGLQDVKARLTELIRWPLERREQFRAARLDPPTGILLYGPAGCGKTLLARAIATESGANFIPIDGPEVFTKWLGESEEAVRHIFRMARQLVPSVIFIDQLDSVAPLRGGGDATRTVERVVNQLLSELDGIEPLSGIVVLAATNRPELVDPAVLRPGRIGTHIFVPLPDAAGRRDIVRLLLTGAPLAEGVDAAELADQIASTTHGFSGAEIKHLVDQAKLAAVRGAAAAPLIRREHVLAALTSARNGRRAAFEAALVAASAEDLSSTRLENGVVPSGPTREVQPSA